MVFAGAGGHRNEVLSVVRIDYIRSSSCMFSEVLCTHLWVGFETEYINFTDVVFALGFPSIRYLSHRKLWHGQHCKNLVNER